MAENQRQLESLRSKGKINAIVEGNEVSQNNFVDDNQSELTIYQNAVLKKREGSSSSEDEIPEINVSSDDQCDSFSSIEKDLVQKRCEGRSSNVQPNHRDRQEASTSKEVQHDTEQLMPRSVEPRQPTMKELAEAQGDAMLKDAQARRSRAYEVAGENSADQVEQGILQIREKLGPNDFYRSVDDDYMLIASHLDQSIREKIVNSEYIDFAKLLRRDRSNIGGDDEFGQQKMVMVNKGGMSYWVPLQDKQKTIDSYARWDQAFKVYLDVYTTKFPHGTTELIQYGHIIQTTSFSYAWDNVYMYDREFRRHMERHPDRSWGVIPQQAWTMFLKNRVNTTPNNNNKFGVSNGSGSRDQKPHAVRKLCILFNTSGECRFGNQVQV